MPRKKKVEIEDVVLSTKVEEENNVSEILARKEEKVFGVIQSIECEFTLREINGKSYRVPNEITYYIELQDDNHTKVSCNYSYNKKTKVDWCTKSMDTLEKQIKRYHELTYNNNNNRTYVEFEKDAINFTVLLDVKFDRYTLQPKYYIA